MVNADTYLSTDSVAARERAAYWRDMICDVFVQLECRDVPDSFFGSIEDRQIGGLQLSTVRSSKHRVLRTRRQIAKSADDYFLVSMQVAGTGIVKQDGRSAMLQPGDFVLYDSTRSYELEFDGPFEELVLKAPRSMIRDRIANPERLTATSIKGNTGMVRVAMEFVRSVASQVHALEPHEIERLSHNVIDVVSAAVGHSLLSQPTSITTTAAAQLIRIKMFIADHLREPNLSRETIAVANGISVRYLNKLFESEQCNVMQWVRDQRLEHITRDLGDPELFGRSISEIAYSWGINSIPHFCRVFKAEHGVTPRQFRAKAQSIISA